MLKVILVNTKQESVVPEIKVPLKRILGLSSATIQFEAQRVSHGVWCQATWHWYWYTVLKSRGYASPNSIKLVSMGDVSLQRL